MNNWSPDPASALEGSHQVNFDDAGLILCLEWSTGCPSALSWAALTNGDGVGLLGVGMPWLNVSAYPYTALDLARARHVHEPKPPENLTLNLDLAQSGLESESCGPGVLPQYRLEAHDYRYLLCLRPLPGLEDTPQVLSRQVLSRLTE